MRTVICAHCTCMAGIGEARFHAAALLFAVEANSPCSSRGQFLVVRKLSICSNFRY